MTDQEILEMIKISLNSPKNQDNLLWAMKEQAEQQLRTRGIVLDKEDPEVCGVIRMRTEWLWRKRASSDQSMPRMLDAAEKDLLFHQKMGGITGDT